MKALRKNLIPGKTIVMKIRQDYNEDHPSVVNLKLKTHVNKEKLNKILHDMELSPFKMHAVPDHSIIKHDKKKRKQAKYKHEETQMYLKQKLA